MYGLYVRFESGLKYNPTDSLQSDDSRVARESTSRAATIPSTSTMLEMKFAAVSALVVPWYPRSSEIGTVPASVGFAELEIIDENCCVHHQPTSFSSHKEHATGVDSLVGRCEWQQSRRVSSLRDKEVILHECGPDDAIAVQRSSPNCRCTE